MTVIPEATLLGFLRTCLRLSEQALGELQSRGASTPASQPLIDGYAAMVHDLQQEKRHDSTLADQSWEWIWEVKRDMNPVQIYGRLAWLNYTLIDLL